MADTDPESKTEEATGKRLSEARAKGDVPKSMDLPQWASLAASAGVVFMSGGWLAQNLMNDLLPFVAHPDAFALENNGGVQVARLAMSAHSNPMTYQGKNGKQYVAVVAGGASAIDDAPGPNDSDALMVYALP